MIKQNRIQAYDTLRGIAVSLMILANSAASLYLATPPFGMRLIGSFAAPSFLLLSGMMLAIAKVPKPRRGIRLLIIASLIDIGLWQLAPFMTFDVLYTIGFGILLTASPAKRFKPLTLWLGGLTMIGLGQLCQTNVGYHFELLEITLPPSKPLLPLTAIVSHILEQLIISGWFPWFPWLGFIWIGAALQRSLDNPQLQNNVVLKLTSASLFWGITTAVWLFTLQIPATREGYCELFYPATVSFCCSAIGSFAVVLFSLQSISRQIVIQKILTPLTLLGQHSLFMYCLHLILIRYILKYTVSTTDIHKFLCVAGWIWLICLLAAYLAENYRSKIISLIHD